MTDVRNDLVERAHALIARLADGSRDDDARDALVRDIAAFQAESIPAYGRLVARRGVDPRATARIDAIPAIPTDVFRWARIAAHAPQDDARVFRTSGTTNERRGEHPLRDLSLYDRAADAAARYALFPDTSHMRLIVLAPDARAAPSSSLSYMLSRFAERFGEGTTHWVWRDDRLDAEALGDALAQAEADASPVALLGTSFAFVHAEDALGDRRFALSRGSRIMHTGGYKGRSRAVEPATLRAALCARYGLQEAFVVSEYGMTELSSQMYEDTLRHALRGSSAGPRTLWVPGWMRATPVDPESLEPVAEDEVGILRIDDTANVDTACCIQTADLARRSSEGIVVLGRAPGSTPRGCSLAADAALSGAGGAST